MTKLFALLSCLLLAALCFSQAATPADDATSKTLIEKSKAVFQDLKAKDASALSSLLSNDFRIVWSDGKLHERGELLGAAQEGALRDFRFYSPEVLPINGDSVLVTFNLIVDMPEGDNDLAPRYQKVSDLWIRQGDDWRLKFEQATPLRPVD